MTSDRSIGVEYPAPWKNGRIRTSAESTRSKRRNLCALRLVNISPRADLPIKGCRSLIHISLGNSVENPGGQIRIRAAALPDLRMQIRRLRHAAVILTWAAPSSGCEPQGSTFLRPTPGSAWTRSRARKAHGRRRRFPGTRVAIPMSAAAPFAATPAYQFARVQSVVATASGRRRSRRAISGIANIISTTRST